MNPHELLHPDLDPALREHLEATDLPALWRSASPLPWGRGGTRRLLLARRDLLVKRELRGGLAGRFFADRYVLWGPFQREWETALHLSSLDLTPRLLCRVAVSRGPLFQVFTLMEEVREGLSLAQLLLGEGEGPTATKLRAAGRAVGELHRAGVVHGDLNAGNILLMDAGRGLLLDLRHSTRHEALPDSGPRRANLARLARSLHKLRLREDAAWPMEPWPSIAEGYAEAWGEREAWLEKWEETSRFPPLVRRLFW